MIKYIEEIFNGYDIRSYYKNNNKYYVARDVLDALGYETSQSLESYFSFIPSKWSDHEDFTVTGKDGKTYNKEYYCLSREGLHLFLERSTKPKARDFQEWIAGPVLTSIEDTGGYINPDIVNESTLSIDNMKKIIEISNTRTKELEEANRRANTAERILKTTQENVDFNNTSIHDLRRIIDASDSEAKKIAEQATFEAQVYKREKDIAYDKLSDKDARISYLESKLTENNIVYSTPIKVQMCHVIDNTNKKTNMMDIISKFIKKN